MTRKHLLMGLMVVLLAPAALAQAQSESLGAYARQQRELRKKEGLKPTKVYTNDNLPYTATISTSSAPAPATTPPAASPASPSQPAAGSKPSEDKKKTKDYWQSRFQAVYAKIAGAEELQKTAEDELSLLRIQRTQTLDPDTQGQLDQQISAKQQQVDSARANTEKAKKELEDLVDEFKESGAPVDWMPKENPPSSGGS